VGVGRFVLELERTAQQSHGIVEAALLKTNDPETAERPEMPAISLDHQFVEPFGFVKQALGMKGGGLRERLDRVDCSGREGGHWLLARGCSFRIWDARRRKSRAAAVACLVFPAGAARAGIVAAR